VQTTTDWKPSTIRKLAIRTPSFQLLMDLCQQTPTKAAEETQHYLIKSIKEDSTRSKPKEDTAGGTFFSEVQRMKCYSHNSLTDSFCFCVHNKDMKDWTQQKYRSAKGMCKSVHIPNRVNEAFIQARNTPCRLTERYKQPDTRSRSINHSKSKLRSTRGKLIKQKRVEYCTSKSWITCS
jgi:hypothetical protein